MTALSVAIEAIALFLFLVGMAGLVVMVKGCYVLRRLARIKRAHDATILMKSPLVPAVSVIATPGDTSRHARDFVRRLLDLLFGNHEVVVVLEHSESELIEWIQEFHLSRSERVSNTLLPTRTAVLGVYESRDPFRLVVVSKEPGGPADALSAGVNIAAAPIIGLVDPESEMDTALLLNLIRPMLADPERTIAVCGVMSPTRAPGGCAAALGTLESLRVWLARGAAFAGWNMLVPVPGASMLVRRDAVVRVGGFRGGALELFLDLQALARSGGGRGRIAFVPEGVSYTRTARSWVGLFRQNANDQAQVARILGRPGPGGLWAIGWGLPALFLVRWVCPVLETAALGGAAIGLALGLVAPRLAGVVLLSTVGVGIVLSMAAVVLRELSSFEGRDPAGLAALYLSAIPENLGYRQVRNLWLIAGFFRGAPKK
jgi:GT2 family glycosyltransferase